MVHCIDPFDASGDAFSVPHYQAIRDQSGASLRQRFDSNIRGAGLSDWVMVHQGRASDVAGGWSTPIDMLFMDGDQSYAAVRAAYDDWSPFLSEGAMLAVHNSQPGVFHESHDGHLRLVSELIRAPLYADVRLVGSTTFARRIGAVSSYPGVA
jgi:hypothetical protein